MNVRPWIVMALIFLVGIVTGSLLTIGLGPVLTKPPGAQEMRDRWMMHLIRDLQLTPDQQAKIQPILDGAEQQLQTAHRDEVGRISGIIEKADESISVVLNPDQQAELKKMEDEHERRFKGRMHGPGMHHGDHGNHADGMSSGGP